MRGWPMSILFTKHAQDMLRVREIDPGLVESAIHSPDWKEEGNEEIMYAFKRVDQKVLRVVYRCEEKCQIVITAYYDRRLNP
jgi:hypothetical protein